MDSTALIVTIGGIALIGLTLWFFFGQKKNSPTSKTGDFYSCPMHPWITSNDPSTDCSICGMKLVRNV